MNGSRTHGRGRICAAPGCATVLSVYNPDRRCSLRGAHEERGRRTAREPRPLELRGCENWDALFQAARPARRFCSDRCRRSAFSARRSRQARTWTRAVESGRRGS